MPVSPICLCPSCPAHRRAASTTPTPCPFYPTSSMTDAQWAVLEPLPPPPGNTAGKGGRPEKHPRRTTLDAIFYVVRGGIAWRQLPRDLPPAMTVYDIFRRWTQADVWPRVHDALRDLVRVYAGRQPLPTAAIVDSQTVRAAETVPSSTAGYDAGKKTKGRKRHIATDTLGLLLAVVVTPATIQDRDGAHRVLAALRAAIRATFATRSSANPVPDMTDVTDLAQEVVLAGHSPNSLLRGRLSIGSGR
ncbi:IS5 family transposase [Frankia sp. Cppng1_Ct_nod]|uniref:IS5 family transposase n=1 Tax=Frankia sp. Cppng1_Ct_nod TaxID=2897162 RepID=UPI001A93BFAE|nr:IS5 family transposase [Frankia sp. Cppng1_Ct_nod]